MTAPARMEAAVPDAARAAVLGWIDGHASGVVELLQTLVRIPSITTDEGDAQGFVAAELGVLCDEVDVWEPDGATLDAHPACFAKGQSYHRRPNVVGILRGTGGGRSLLLNAHIDVVPPQPDAQWSHGPWSGDLEDGSVHGRGSLDDKSGTAVMIGAARAIRACGIRLRGDLALHSVIDEEWGGTGTLACMLRGHKADAGILLEPCGPDVYPAGRGGQAFRVTVRGKGAHPGASWTGVSALEKAVRILEDLKAFEAERQELWRTPLFAEYPIFAPIVVGRISADNIPSKVPERCVFEGLYGYPPGEHWREAREAFERRVAQAAGRDPWMAEHPPTVEWIGLNKEGAETPVDHPIVGCLTGAVEAATGLRPRVRGFPAGTDLPLLVRYGPVPSVLYGAAGDWADAHSSTEHVRVDALLDAAKAVAAVRWCG